MLKEPVREPTSPFTLILPPDLRAELERLAAENERSLGAEARVAFRRHIEANAAHHLEAETAPPGRSSKELEGAHAPS